MLEETAQILGNLITGDFAINAILNPVELLQHEQDTPRRKGRAQRAENRPESRPRLVGRNQLWGFSIKPRLKGQVADRRYCANAREFKLRQGRARCRTELTRHADE